MNRGDYEWREYLRALKARRDAGEELTAEEAEELSQGIMAGALR